MLELASLGAKVLQVRSVELGMVHNMPVFVRSSFDKPEDIDPHGTPPGTLICSEEEIMESHVVTGIAFSKDEAQISIREVQDKPGVAAAILWIFLLSPVNGLVNQSLKVAGVDAVPGKGSRVPLYILGSSMFGATLAAYDHRLAEAVIDHIGAIMFGEGDDLSPNSFGRSLNVD